MRSVRGLIFGGNLTPIGAKSSSRPYVKFTNLDAITVLCRRERIKIKHRTALHGSSSLYLILGGGGGGYENRK
jgi:hypothetical protein